LKQTYQITNVSSSAVTGLRLFQFLHGLHSRTAVFDRNNYGEGGNCGGVPCNAYQYDMTMRATVRAFIDFDRPFEDEEGQPPRATDVTDIFGFVPAIDDAFLRSLLGKEEAAIGAAFRAIFVGVPPEIISGIARSETYVVNDDVVAFHSNDAPIGIEDVSNPPFGWETGPYGVFPADSHVVGKPPTGVHLSVEGGTLKGPASFEPGAKWVRGALVFALGNLNPRASVTFDVLLSVSTVQAEMQRASAVSSPMLEGLARFLPTIRLALPARGPSF
jgi:hypothetical protein